MRQPELGKKILELRQNRGLTQAQLAESCHVSLRTIQRIEAAEVTPRAYTTGVIFSCLGCDPQSLSEKFPGGETSGQRLKRRLRRSLKCVQELFNLKTNTMKKLSVLSLFAVLVCAGLCLTTTTKAQQIEGWFLAGDSPKSYKIGLDKTVYKTGRSSALLESAQSKINGFGTLMQTCSAEEYLGKRIKMTAYVKSKDVVEWAGMWLRIDPVNGGTSLGFDNMGDRPIKGTKDWTKCEIVMDVPKNSATLNFGILLSGTGKVWFDNVTFEVVDDSVLITTQGFVNKKPTNLDFGQGK